MKLTMAGIKDREAWEKAGIQLPGYDVEEVSEKARKAPRWVHFGIGNIFRVFIGGIADGLLEDEILDRGITCVETFDYDFRQRVLNKHADFREPGEVAEYFDSPCLMVGIQGQTKDMIRYDIDCLKRYFKLGTVNVYNNNTTPIRRDQALVDWFMDEYQWLMEDPAVEVLYEITDFGVG